jgi:hypothetical protein
MKYKILILIWLLVSCAPNFNNIKNNTPFNSKGLAYIYNESDFQKKIIKKKLNNSLLQVAHNKLRAGSLIKIINPQTNESIILKSSKKIQYPGFYKILITKPVVKKLNLKNNLPLIEVIEVKKNKSFVAKHAKIYSEEKKIHSNAPVEIVKIDNISKNKSKSINTSNNKIFIILGEFYSKESAVLLKERISKELKNYDTKKLKIRSKKTNKITLLSGPYRSVNLLKNDYIELINFGFEELDISINE